MTAANMALWDSVAKTDPANTKRVNQRGGFTAIAAHSQIMEATRAFGPIGIGWGYEAEAPIFHESLVFVRVTLWHGSRDNTFGPVIGGAEWKTAKGYLDSDGPKKATTDALTKLLSQLGFNADVFLGKFDDNKYVEQMAREFGPANDQNGTKDNGGNGKDAPFPQGPAKNRTELKTMTRQFWREVEGCGDPDELDALLKDKDNVKLVAQLIKALPFWWEGGTQQSGEPFEGLEAVISKKQSELAVAAVNAG